MPEFIVIFDHAKHETLVRRQAKSKTLFARASYIKKLQSDTRDR